MNNSQVFVTGGTGLIGRFVVENLLARGMTVIMMVRDSSQASRSERIESLKQLAMQHGADLQLVSGDLSKPLLGLNDAGRAGLATAAHCFHLAALYDITASAQELLAANVEGTQRILSTLKACGYEGLLHHISSIAVAGNYQGVFTEQMFSEGQAFPHAYHESKFESEKLVRESGFRVVIYRPSAVVGHSLTGEMDRVDGPYLGFRALQGLAWGLPRWARVPVPKIRGAMNVVPVDYVAGAIVHLGLGDGCEGKTFHLVDPKPLSFNKMNALFLRAMGGPQLGPEFDLGRIPGLSNAMKFASALPSIKEIRRELLEDLGLPPDGIDAMNLAIRFDCQQTQSGLKGSGLECPSLERYARALVRYYEDHLDDRHNLSLRLTRSLGGKTVLITGASRGIGAEVARMAAEAGANVLLVARDEAALQAQAKALQAKGGSAFVLPADLSDLAEVDRLAAQVCAEHGGVDVLVHNAARSIRRPISESSDRFHDYERTMLLNYFSPVRLTLSLLPSLRERRGSIVNVLTMGALMPGPYFSAYIASKSALNAFGDSLAAEHHGEGVHVAQIYLPLVKTEMVAPTKDYANRNDLLTPTVAAQMVLEGVVDRRRRVMTTAGRFYALSNLLAPRSATRILNLLNRTFPTGNMPTPFPMEKMLITQWIGGAPI